MDGLNSNALAGSLHISTAAISKIARMATLEIEGVAEVCSGTLGVKRLFSKVVQQKPVEVTLTDDVAEITVSIQVHFGTKIPSLSEKVQENVKSTVQNMTGITVSKVNVIVTGVVLLEIQAE